MCKHKAWNQNTNSKTKCQEEKLKCSGADHIRHESFEVLGGLLTFVLLSLSVDLFGLFRSSSLHLPLSLPQTCIDTSLPLQLLLFFSVYTLHNTQVWVKRKVPKLQEYLVELCSSNLCLFLRILFVQFFSSSRALHGFVALVGLQLVLYFAPALGGVHVVVRQ